MAGRINKKIKKSPGWNRNRASYKRRPGKAGRYFGLGRYFIGCIAIVVFYQFVVEPALRYIMSHQIFDVRQVVVDNTQYIDSEKIINTAGIEIGKNIFEIDIRKVSEILESEFTAGDFAVYKSLPNSITIRVYEKNPVALLNMKELIGVDKNGVPLPYVGAELVENLPILTGIDNISALTDSTVRARLQAGLNLLERIKDKAPSTYKRISEVNVSSMNTLGISLIDNGLEVIIGEKDWVRKIPVLDRVINEVTIGRKAVKAVDIRFGEKVIVVK